MKVAGFGIAVLLVSQSVFAADYVLDTSHSSVGFVARHLVSKVSGQFDKFDGKFSYDPKKVEDTKVTATVEANSINTREKKRDDHLKSDDFFAVKKFPKLTFVSTKVKSDGKTSEGEPKFKMSGDLTMRGVTKPVTFDVVSTGEMEDPFAKGSRRVGFTATTKVNRKDFGINWSKVFDNGGVAVGDEVVINLAVEAYENKGK